MSGDEASELKTENGTEAEAATTSNGDVGDVGASPKHDDDVMKPEKKHKKEDKVKKEKRDRSGSHERSSKKSSKKSSRRTSRSRSPKRRRSSRSKSPDRRRRRDSSRERRRSPDRSERRRRSPSPPRRRRRSPSPAYRRRSPDRRRSPSPRFRRLPGPERRDVSVVDALGLNMPFTATKGPPKGVQTDLSQEERDQRTIFIMQLAFLTKPRDLEDFFSAVGTVRDVRIITDSKTRRTKGIAYCEFWEAESVPLAIGLNGQALCGAPLRIQPTQAERSRAFDGTVGAPMGIGQGMAGTGSSMRGPIKLYIGGLHTSIDEDMLKGIFEPFGRITDCEIVREANGESKGYANLTFRNGEDGTRAMEQLNGFDLAGRPMKVGLMSDMEGNNVQSLQMEEMDKVDLGTAGRLQLMAKLAAGTGLALPSQAQQVLSQQQHATIQSSTPSIATQCFMLSNMFDPKSSEPNWATDIRDDVIEECTRHGGVVHIYVDTHSAEGNVYVKCASTSAAVNSVNSLHGRWFAGKVITANYVPVPNYHQLFSDSLTSTQLLAPSHATQPMRGGQAASIY